MPLHLEPEIALLALSPEFNNSMEMIAWISKSLPADALVVVKEQPFSFGVRSRRYYHQLMQIGNVIGRRSPHGLGLDRGIFKNPLLILGIAVEIVFSWSILYFPPVQKVLQTGPVELVFYLLAWAGIPCLLGFDWLRKQSRSWR